ncbi:hypothetical protein [Microbacterium sp. 77mftsu3.1]|uniref:hypothetical protein n=1 Tax=Microbacterium sp. 77mftsu3.1 TaxID=1761802 RepID=UPI00037F65F8|nr:hypothetical protein [Microbacterium sp. 77mftsu3.1]SDH37297.1 hypothetical protein SAMN04488590_3163 [Microbacterium sp. 77mftsu3.1]
MSETTIIETDSATITVTVEPHEDADVSIETEQAAEAAAPKPVALPAVEEMTLWQKPSCSQCIGAKLGLKAKGVTPVFKELLADENADNLQLFKNAGLASAPILQFPAVTFGDEVLFTATTVAGNRADVIEQYGAALKALAAREAEAVPLAA